MCFTIPVIANAMEVVALYRSQTVPELYAASDALHENGDQCE
jgi:hypothetical protein